MPMFLLALLIYYFFPIYLKGNVSANCIIDINIHSIAIVILSNYPMMRFVYRIINLFRGRRSQKPVPVVPVLKEDYERWLGI